MSLPFNDTSTYKGAVQMAELEIGNLGDISGNTTNLKIFTAYYNLGMDSFMALAINSSGTWQFDDSNHTKYPIIKTNIVSGQRDYSFTTDEQSNLILDIYKVAILPSATSTQYSEIEPVDTQSDPNSAARFNDSSFTGVPYDYDKTGNGIIFGSVPNYNATNGLLMYINRESYYMTSSDTTQKPGIPGIFQEYPAQYAMERYARKQNHANYQSIKADRIQMENDIKAYFGRREKDVRKIMTGKSIQYI